MKKKLWFLSMLLFAFCSSTSWAQDKSVSGTVISADDGLPLPGVSVIIKGTSTGAVTDFDGLYKIVIPKDISTPVLSFNFVGYKPKEIAVGSQTTINVTLEADVKQLEEVVVTGYGSQLKQDLTGNIAKVSGEEIQNTPVPTVEQALQGRAAGVFIQSNNGKLGGGMQVNIRGASSISASNQPLYVIDGIPVTTSNLSSTDAPTNPLADINFNDIESIDILKDASASAIYGSRAANGVVLITTKKGSQGKTKFNLNLQTGFSTPTGRRDWLNASEYIELFTEAARNADDRAGVPYNDPSSSTADAIATFDFLSGHTDWRTLENDTDWQDEAFQDAPFQQIDFSASGGSEKVRYFSSIGYLDQTGILIGEELKRLNGRLNLDVQASEKVNFGVNMTVTHKKQNRASDDNAFSTPMQLVAQSPLTPVYDENGDPYNEQDAALYYPATVEVRNAKYETTVLRSIGNFYGNYKILNGLTFNSSFGFDILTQQEDNYQGSKTESRDTQGYGYSSFNTVLNYTFTNYLSYTKNFGGNHDLDFTAGMEFQEFRNDWNSVEGTTFTSDDLQKIASAGAITGGTSNLIENALLSYFGRANYKFNNKYLLSLSARVDGSSRFGANNRYGFFPAVSAGWIISDEDFLSGFEALSFLKLRASYGIVGNAGIGSYAAQGVFGAEPYAGQSSIQPNNIDNPDLTWERAQKTDIGFDFGFLNDRITGEFDYYITINTDLLLDVPVRSSSGFRTQFRNIGELENKGVELVINTNNINGEFTWNTSFNIARNVNTIKSLGGQDIITSGSSRWLNAHKVGESLASFYGVEYAGVDPANGDALFYINDPEGTDPNAVTNNFNQANPVILGSPLPDFYGGITNTFTYKGFDLNFTFQWVYGNEIFNGGGVFQSANAAFYDNQTKDQLRRWQQPGDVTDVPQARLFSDNGSQASSRYLSDGSYIRLKNLSFGYNLPSSLLERANISKARIFMTAQNLLTFTNYNGWDPEVNTDYRASNQSQGNDFYAAPQNRTITFGVNVGF